MPIPWPPVLIWGTACDIGSGDGAMIDLLAPACELLYCLEPSEAMREAASKHLPRWPQCRQLVGSGESIPLPDESVDTVLSLQSLQYTNTPAQVLQEAQRILKPGGRIFILTLQQHELHEAEQYGHRHNGFRESDLQDWLPSIDSWRCYALAAEARPPHFISLLAHGRKAKS